MSHSNRPTEHTTQILSDKGFLRSADTPEIFILVYQNTWLHFPEDRNFGF